VSEADAKDGRYGPPACRAGWDSVDAILADWARERPDLDFAPVGIVTRLARVRAHLDAALADLFADHGLTPADFQVIVTLRRRGEPYAMPQARLMDALGLTSGTVSVRLDRLERAGIVARRPEPESGRGSRVTLTDRGLALFDELAPIHLANEERLLSALTVDEQAHLADLLRRLLRSLEEGGGGIDERLGALVEPAHLARARRVAVGLSDRVGLLLSAVQPDGPAAAAGLQRGDLLVAVDGIASTSSTGLAVQLDRLDGRRSVAVTYLRGDEERQTRLPLR
jgi:DNA-binding MarR family transcriptional regulator